MILGCGTFGHCRQFRGTRGFHGVPLQSFIDALEAGTAKLRTGPVFALDDIVDAHRAMEESRAFGKIVVVT